MRTPSEDEMAEYHQIEAEKRVEQERWKEKPDVAERMHQQAREWCLKNLRVIHRPDLNCPNCPDNPDK